MPFLLQRVSFDDPSNDNGLEFYNLGVYHKKDLAKYVAHDYLTNFTEFCNEDEKKRYCQKLYNNVVEQLENNPDEATYTIYASYLVDDDWSWGYLITYLPVIDEMRSYVGDDDEEEEELEELRNLIDM